MEDQKPWPAFALNQDFTEERRLKPIVKKVKTPKLQDVLNKLEQLKRITDGGLEAKLPAAGRFSVIFSEKKKLFQNH